MDDILTIKDLTISFRQGSSLFHAVDHVNLSLKRGASLGIVGESGSGKSLTALSILNLLPPATAQRHGSIVFTSSGNNSFDLLKTDKKMLKSVRGNHISMIFQEPMTSLNPVYTCGNQMLESMLEHQEITKTAAREKCLSLFEDVKLPDPERIFKSYPHELSGGQRQRVMIAMALSCNPEILIADEPTTALDVTVQKTILELLKELKAKYSMSLIFISHDLGVVSEIADEIAVMYQGKLVEKNTTQNILNSPLNQYTKGLIACRPSLHDKPERLLTLTDFMETDIKDKDQKEIILPAKSPSQPEENVLFRVESLDKTYTLRRNFFGKAVESTKALENISLKIHSGETLGLVGESGSGKSTLGRTLLQLLSFEKGEIFYKDENIRSFDKNQLKLFRKSAQIIFQDPYSSLNPRISVGDMIAEPLRVFKLFSGRKERKSRVMQLLSDVRLGEDYYNRYPHELSGGQRQRVAIARVLALQPEFIVCDEAVSALDVSVQAEILNLFQDLKAKYNLTYVFISHDFSVIRFMADRVAVMKEGRIVELGETHGLLNRPESSYTQELLNSIPALT